MAQVAAPGMFDLEYIGRVVVEEAARCPAIGKVILFGSYARGDAMPSSDIDLRIVRSDEAVLGFMELGAFGDAVRERTGWEVDLVSSRSIGKKTLAESIEREGVVLYER